MEQNVFKDIEPTEKLPSGSKQAVLQRIETAKLMLNMWDLFAAKRVEMNMNFIDEKVESDKKKLPPKTENK
jgi:hypothetical protein